MLDKDNKMLDIDKWNLGNMNKNLKTISVLEILICLPRTERMFDGAILSETTGKNYTGTENNWNMSDFSSKRNNE